MPRKIDLTGKVFGRLTVIEYSHKTNHGTYYYKCKCSCGTDKVIEGSKLKNGTIKSCGCLRKECFVKDLSGKRFGNLLVKKLHSKKGKHNHTYSIFLCLCDCGKETLVSSSNLQKGNTTSCGCVWKSKMRGSNHPQWKGGVTSEFRKIRTSLKYGEWREAVFTRDFYTCQKCKKVGGKLNAHHKQSFADNPKLRTEIKNGVTLCAKCHQTFHKKYGYRNNNYQQMTAFLK